MPITAHTHLPPLEGVPPWRGVPAGSASSPPWWSPALPSGPLSTLTSKRAFSICVGTYGEWTLCEGPPSISLGRSLHSRATKSDKRSQLRLRRFLRHACRCTQAFPQGWAHQRVGDLQPPFPLWGRLCQKPPSPHLPSGVCCGVQATESIMDGAGRACSNTRRPDTAQASVDCRLMESAVGEGDENGVGCRGV